MKRFILFILILLSSINTALACGFYPYGENVRFTMFNPMFSKFKEFDEFNYSSNSFMPRYEWNEKDTIVDYRLDENLLLWSARYNNVVSLTEISHAIYETSPEEFVSTSSNAFIKLLFKKNDLAAISYVTFAKRCSDYNMRFEDPWERYGYATIPGRKKLIEEAFKIVSTLTDNDLVSRYTFLAIRLAYYNNEPALVQKLYASHFDIYKIRKNCIDYWSMYFLCISEKNAAKANYYAAQVFSNSAEKRFMVSQQYNTTVPIDSTLQYAKTNKERAAVWLLAGVKNPWMALSCMEKMYALDPNSTGLSFLLLREINKLEDWIYTPLYTEFAPSVDFENWGEQGSVSYDSIYKERIRKDRLYASKVLTFVKKVNMSTVHYPEFWKASKVYLYVMTEQYQEGLKEVNNQAGITKKDVHIADHLAMLKAFCELALQPRGATVLTPSIKQEILNQQAHNNPEFIFALSKELEFRGNTTDATVLMSSLNQSFGSNEEYEWEQDIFWRTRNGSYLVYGNFYTNYFDYIDYQYSIEQIKALINRVENTNGKDAYSVWAYTVLRKDLGRLYDLTGTKCMRKNDLSSALYYFKQVPDSIWNTNPYTYLDANPFYTNFYNEHTVSVADTITYNKVTLVKTLKKYLQLANNPETKDRDYYYFLVANCYLNMTYYGNSWVMKRYAWSSGGMWEREKKNDIDYAEVSIAKQFYLKAKQQSKTKKFAALCLRMAGRCEKYFLMNKHDRWAHRDDGKSFEDVLFDENKYYKQLQKEYPDDYDELLSNCESFTPYFAARR